MVVMNINKNRPGAIVFAPPAASYVPPHMRSPKFLSNINTGKQFGHGNKSTEPASPRSPRKLVKLNGVFTWSEDFSLGQAALSTAPIEPRSPRKLVKVAGMLQWQDFALGAPATALVDAMGAPKTYKATIAQKPIVFTRPRAMTDPDYDDGHASDLCSQEETWAELNNFWGRKDEDRTHSQAMFDHLRAVWSEKADDAEKRAQEEKWAELESFWQAKAQQLSVWGELQGFWQAKESERAKDAEWGELQGFWQQSEEWHELQGFWQAKDSERAYGQEEMWGDLKDFWQEKAQDHEWNELNSFWQAKAQQHCEWGELQGFWQAKESERAQDAEWGELQGFWQAKESERAQDAEWCELQGFWQAKESERAQDAEWCELQGFWQAKESERAQDAEWGELQGFWQAKYSERAYGQEEMWGDLKDFWQMKLTDRAQRLALRSSALPTCECSTICEVAVEGFEYITYEEVAGELASDDFFEVITKECDKPAEEWLVVDSDEGSDEDAVQSSSAQAATTENPPKRWLASWSW
jgi:hypothetical protein